MRIILRFSRVAIVLLGIGRATGVHGQTDEIQVYDAAIASTGAFNLTLHNNFTPSGGNTPGFPGAIAADKSLNGVAEWAYGVTPWFEAGLYLPLYSITRNNNVMYNGFKLRTLFVTPDAAKRDFFTASISNLVSTPHIGMNEHIPPKSARSSVLTWVVSISSSIPSLIILGMASRI